MIEYIKILIAALISGITLPLPVSSAAHFSFLNGVLNFSEDTAVLGFYYSVMSLAFSLVVFVLLRKIYLLCFKSLFDREKKLGSYRRLMKNLAVSLVPLLVLFVPVNSEGKLLCDLFDNFLGASSFLLVAFASVVCALVLVISVWYTRQSNADTKKGTDTKTAIRMAVYQLISYIIPGISHVSSASTNMLICDVESKVIVREICLYLAPQMFLVNLVKVIRFALSDMIINPVMVIIAFAAVAATSAIVITRMSKINIRRIFPFFVIYCILTGVIFAVLSFVLK